MTVKIRFVDGSGIELSDVDHTQFGKEWYVVHVGPQTHYFANERIQAINEIAV